jgi:Na+-translocating ferredoxin:NAD+ oxidoreductase RnfG subunit
MKKSLKTVVIMLAIILVCGGLLAILSDLLYVSDNERIDRAIQEIYAGEDVSLNEDEVLDFTDFNNDTEDGVIKSAYKLTNGDYLVLSTGKKGYSNGTVTVYVAISVDGGVATVKKVVENSYTAQTLMSKLSSYYGEFVGVNSSNVGVIDDMKVSGATGSSRAVNNAVITAIEFIQTQIGG